MALQLPKDVQSFIDDHARKNPPERRNIYVCSVCKGHVITRDRDYGVTPFMIGCKATAGCTGHMQSSMYRVFDQTVAAEFEWYRPDTLDGLSDGEATHVKMGGLLLRRISHG